MKPLSLDTVIRRNEDVIVFRRFPGLGTILVHVPGRREFLLRGAGELLWTALDHPATVCDLRNRLVGTYHIAPETASADVFRFVSDLGRADVIRPSTGGERKQSDAPAYLIDKSATVRQYLCEHNVPYMTQLVLTRRCPYRCRHCYQSEFSAGGLSQERLVHVLDDLARLGCVYLRLTGGEALTRPDLFQVLEIAKARQFVCSLNTNGHLLTERIVRSLATLSPLEVCVSLYGANPRTHEQITCVPGSFSRCLRAMVLLRKANISVAVNYLIMKHNYGELQAAQGIADECGADFRPDYVLFPKSNGDRSPLGFRLGPTELAHLASEHILPPPRARFCSPARCKMSIDANGDVFPCEMIMLPLGNVNQQTLYELWTEGAAVRRFRSQQIGMPDDCQKCSLKACCARCPGLSLMESGDLHEKSPFLCMAAKAFYRTQQGSKKGITETSVDTEMTQAV